MKIRPVYILLLFVAMLSSCATITKTQQYKLRVTSKTFDSKIEINDSIYSLPAKVNVTRSKHDLSVKWITGNSIRNYTVKSSPDPSFVYGNLAWLCAAPIAYVVDLTNPKRFYYGKSVSFNSKDTSSIIRPPLLKHYYHFFQRDFLTDKGNIFLRLSIPFINGYFFQPGGEGIRRDVGFWGFSCGAEYYYKKNRYLSLNAAASAGYMVPMGAVDFYGEYEQMSTFYLSLTDDYKIKRYHFGYGINYCENIWELKYGGYRDTVSKTRAPLRKANQSLGITLNGYFQFCKIFYLGVIYRPTLLNISPDVGFRYQHLISIDLMFKIRLKK